MTTFNFTVIDNLTNEPVKDDVTFYVTHVNITDNHVQISGPPNGVYFRVNLPIDHNHATRDPYRFDIVIDLKDDQVGNEDICRCVSKSKLEMKFNNRIKASNIMISNDAFIDKYRILFEVIGCDTILEHRPKGGKCSTIFSQIYDEEDKKMHIKLFNN